MNMYTLTGEIILLLSIQTIDAQCRRNGTSAFGFLVSSLSGAVLATQYDPCEIDFPTYDITYRGAPRYAYDYPAYIYSPVYAYWNTLQSYPRYY